MASKYAGTKTEQNLKDAFSGESQARNKYTYYASAAKKAGYEQMSALYLETADQEKEHAKMWFKELHGIGTPEENLADAAAGENYEWTDMYAQMAKDAKEEGFDAYIMFVVQMENVKYFTPNKETHKAFAEVLVKAESKGVKIMAYNCVVTEKELKINNPVEIKLNK